MTANLKAVQLNTGDGILSVSAGLRKLADEIDKGDFDAAHNLIWCMDCGDGRVELGLLGQTAEFVPTAYYLAGLAKHTMARAAFGESA